MKVVLDTNVLVSGILFTGPPHQILQAWSEGRFERVCADPDDDKFLACALANGAGTIVSGDKHLVDVSGYHGIEVLRPRAFVDRYLAG